MRSSAPLLLCRDKVNVKLIIADGYHRLCAGYDIIDEDAVIPCTDCWKPEIDGRNLNPSPTRSIEKMQSLFGKAHIQPID